MKKTAKAKKKQIEKENKGCEKAKDKSQAIAIKRITISNSRGVGSFKDILLDPLTGPELLNIGEPELSNTIGPEPFDTAVAKLSNNAIADLLRISNSERIDSQISGAKTSLSSIFATNNRLSNSQKKNVT